MKALHLIGWIIHWTAQGLLLSLFMMIASFWIMLARPLVAVIETFAEPFAELTTVAKIAVVAGYVTLSMISLAVFTASLATMLKAFPLRPYTGFSKQVLHSNPKSDPLDH